jgi:hypothetical protein
MRVQCESSQSAQRELLTCCAVYRSELSGFEADGLAALEAAAASEAAAARAAAAKAAEARVAELEHRLAECTRRAAAGMAALVSTVAEIEAEIEEMAEGSKPDEKAPVFSMAELEAMREDVFGQDIPVFHEMRFWPREAISTYFRSGGETKPEGAAAAAGALSAELARAVHAEQQAREELENELKALRGGSASPQEVRALRLELEVEHLLW